MANGKKCSFGKHIWLNLTPEYRKDHKWLHVKVCSICGKQKARVKRTPQP